MATYTSFEEAVAANAKGADLVEETCPRCLGPGNVGYGSVASYNVTHGCGVIGACFQCLGTGVVTVRYQSIKARAKRKAERDAKLAEETAKKAALRATRQNWNAANPEIVALINELADHTRQQGLAYDLWNNLTHIPTSAQVEALHKIKADRDAREAERRPVQTGKQTITGRILSIKDHENMYGTTAKMVVKDDRGFKVWGTMTGPIRNLVYDAWLVSLGGDVEREIRESDSWVWRDWAKSTGQRVTFTATVDPAQGDDSFDFGFFKRPTKPALA